MQQQWLIAAGEPRWIWASVMLAFGAGAPLAASAYSAQITSSSGSAIYFLDLTAPADSKTFDPEMISTISSAPLTLGHDTSISVGPADGHFATTTGAYNAWVEPGGLHLSARSAASITYAAVAAGADRSLRAQDGGSVDVLSDDGVTFSVAGLAPGTPFLMDVSLRVNGNFGVFNGPAGTPITPNAYAEGSGFWGFALLVPGGRPAGVPSSLTNHFDDQAYFAARYDGTSFDEFSQYGYPKLVTVTMYAVNGQAATIELYARLNTAAFADASYETTSAGLVEAGVHGNLADTVAWGGIAAARQIDDTPVALGDVSVQSNSGFDYRNEYVSTVPEPSPAALTSIAVLCCSWLPRARVVRGSANAA